MTITDIELNSKYELGINRLILEHDRIKLPELVENIKSNPNYMMIDEDAGFEVASNPPVVRSEWSSAWDEVTKSRLIESLLINIPVMPIILYEKEYKSYEVIDGKERLKTIIDFYSDRLTLTGLEVETNLEGCTYSALPARVKDRLDRRSLDLINCMPASDNQSESEIKKLIDAVKERYSL